MTCPYTPSIHHKNLRFFYIILHAVGWLLGGKKGKTKNKNKQNKNLNGLAMEDSRTFQCECDVISIPRSFLHSKRETGYNIA
jgi:hypothetical protein